MKRLTKRQFNEIEKELDFSLTALSRDKINNCANVFLRYKRPKPYLSDVKKDLRGLKKALEPVLERLHRMQLSDSAIMIDTGGLYRYIVGAHNAIEKWLDNPTLKKGGRLPRIDVNGFVTELAVVYHEETGKKPTRHRKFFRFVKVVLKELEVNSDKIWSDHSVDTAIRNIEGMYVWKKNY